MSKLDKTPLASKKFIAFILSLLSMTGILVIALLSQQFIWAMALFMSIGALGITSVSIGYVISQGALDKFITGVSHLTKGLKNDRTPEEDME